ncbi:hypothetical protein [Acidaminococcus fermentans]|uniref:hypothetical protein n=1 Tax=Acidaminococcus fermentans TaxID=905 RepID=UPI0030771955
MTMNEKTIVYYLITKTAWKVVKDPAAGRYRLLRDVESTRISKDYYKEDYHCRCEAQAMADYLNRKERKKKKD